MKDYVEDRELNLFRRDGFCGVSHANDEEAHFRIYDVVRRARDRSTFSRELVQAITDWPSEHLLSRRRHCLVRPFPILAGDKVLELGCEGGAITRYLGEIGALVTAVESSLQRASIASERCRDLQNVRVVLDNSRDFCSREQFDWVFLLGMLEHLPAVTDLTDPIRYCLATAMQFLSPKGKLVVAIENKLGLKYFNGAAILSAYRFTGFKGSPGGKWRKRVVGVNWTLTWKPSASATGISIIRSLITSSPR